MSTRSVAQGSRGSTPHLGPDAVGARVLRWTQPLAALSPTLAMLDLSRRTADRMRPVAPMTRGVRRSPTNSQPSSTVISCLGRMYMLALRTHSIVLASCFVYKTVEGSGFPRAVLTGLLAFSVFSGAARARPSAVQQVLVLQVVRPRQPDARSLHRQLPRRPGPARRAARQCRPGRRGPDGSRRRDGTCGRRLHPVHVRRSPRAGPHRDGRRPGRGLRAQASAAAVPRDATPVRLGRSALSARRAARAKTKPPSRSSTIFRAWSTTSCRCFPRPGRCSW